jgi:dTDP-4-amino-4,6-dideoxygalactose transaminase
MDRIPLVDLQSLHSPLASDLRSAVSRVIDSGRFILDLEVAAFERELAAALGFSAAVGLSSGTDALTALLLAAEVGPGDEVVTTPYSFCATAESVARLGARPVFADIDLSTFTLDDHAAVARLSPRTKAVLPVHLFGRVAVLPTLRAACATRPVALLEDAAQAIGATGLGAGRGVALSFFPSKNLGGFGDGGAVATNDAALAVRIRELRRHGLSEDGTRHERLGGNFRLDEIQAALLRVELPHLVRWNLERRRLAEIYRERLTGLPLVLPPPDEGCVWNQFVVRIPADRRADLRRHLDHRGIASAIYYPVPLHLQPAFAFLGHRPGDFPNAERAAREALALPIHPCLSDHALERVTAAISDFFG